MFAQFYLVLEDDTRATGRSSAGFRWQMEALLLLSPALTEQAKREMIKKKSSCMGVIVYERYF